MAKICMITGKKPMTGNKVSHSNRKSKTRQMPNLQVHRYFLPSEGRWVRLKLSTSAIRDIDKRGIEAVWKEMRAKR